MQPLTLHGHIMLDGVLERAVADVRVLPAARRFGDQPLAKLRGISGAARQQVCTLSSQQTNQDTRRGFVDLVGPVYARHRLKVPPRAPAVSGAAPAHAGPGHLHDASDDAVKPLMAQSGAGAPAARGCRGRGGESAVRRGGGYPVYETRNAEHSL